MKRLFLPAFLLFMFFPLSSVSVASEIKTKYGQTYICGDSFEVNIKSEPLLTTKISRSNSWSRATVTLMQAGKFEMLFSIRIIIRNLTSQYYGGLTPDSFKLVGYVRGRPVEYLPEIMAPYDYGIDGAYNFYDKMYYQTYAMAPLRKIDMQLAYRVNPNLVDWELHINPQVNDWTFTLVEKPLTDLEPCSDVFQLVTVWNEKTGKAIKYNR